MKDLKFRDDLYADVRVERRFTTKITYLNGDVKEMNELDVTRAFIRVFDGNMWYYSSTTNVCDLQNELDSLCAFAKPNPKISENPVVKAFEVNKDKKIVFADDCVDKIPLSDKAKLISDVLPMIKGDYVSVVTGIYLDRYSRFNFKSSKGADIEYDYQTSGYSFIVQFADKDNNFRHNFSDCKTFFKDLVITPEKVKDFLSESENFLLHAKPLEKAGVYPVILSPLATGIFAHESFGHKSEADFMLGDETMKKEWAIGKKVGSDILSIVDEGGVFGSGYAPYDDEGTKCSETYLIKDGVLTGRLHSVSTAVELGEKPTGNARAVNCDFEPIVRMTTTHVKGGSSTFDELVKGVKHGYFIKDVSHGSGMSTFTIAPTICYEIVDGKIGDPVKIAVITGDVFKTLSLVDGLSKEYEILCFVTGGCGKMEQYPLPVGMGGPYMRVKEMGVQ